MKTEEELISEEFEKVKKNPHKYVMDWMESNLIHVGSRVFKLLALQPCSLILPDIPFQSTHIRVSMNILFLSPPSSGKCLRKGTKVLMEDGTSKNIEDVLPGELVFSLDEDTLKMKSSEVIASINNGKKLCYNLKTNSGYEMSLTSNHPLYTINGWKNLESLKVGDKIAISRNHIIKPKSILSDNTIKLIAYLISDGGITCQVNFTNANKEILDDFENSVLGFSNNLKIRKYQKKNNLASSYKVSCLKYNKGQIRKKNDLVIFLEQIGLYGKNSYDKFIPDCIMSLENSKMVLFLNRLFSCDGCLQGKNGKYYVSYSSCSKKMIYQIKEILSRFNIISSIRYRKTKCNHKYFNSYELMVFGNDTKRFIRQIGVILGKEKRSIEILNDKNISRVYKDKIPKEVWEKVIQEKNRLNKHWKEITKEIVERNGCHKFHTEKDLNRMTLLKVNLPICKKYGNSDIFWDEIKEISVEDTEEVYDLSIKGNHNFVANGIYVHNSTIAKKYSQITYNPYIVRKVTSAKLSHDLSNMRLFTLILEDFSQIGNDYDVIKVIEGALGDEKSIIKKTMRDDITKRTQGVGLMSGTWSDLARYLEYFKGGLLFRFVLLFLDLTKEQHLETGKYISDNIGNKKESNEMEIKQKAIKLYYDEVMKIMANENKDIPQIHGYFFSDKIKDEIYKEWASITSKLAGKLEFYFNRELHEAYRFLVSSALLNVFHRKVENGIIHPNEEDLKLAKELMLDNLRNKVSILQSKMYLSSIRSASDLRRVLDADVPERIKRIIINLSPYSNGLKSKF